MLLNFKYSFMKNLNFKQGLLFLVSLVFMTTSCKPKNANNTISADAAAKVYVAPGKYDEFYNFVSGGFSGQMTNRIISSSSI